MEKIHLDKGLFHGPKIMLFAEGTVLKPKSWLSLYHHKSYVPIGNAAGLTVSWQRQGADIIYCTSRRKRQMMDMVNMLDKYGFAGSALVSRAPKESYAELVEAVQPDILIEDDCKSIGGAWQMCITKVTPDVKEKINSIIVPEFKGIDHLSMDIKDLII